MHHHRRQKKCTAGQHRLKNIDGEGNITDADRKIIGDTYPDFIGGLNNTFTFKGFDLSIFMNFQIGNDVLNYQRARLMATYGTNYNQHRDLAGRFTYIDAAGNYVSEPSALKALNANATTHAVKSDGPESNITITTSDMVEDGSFLRINNVTLGYTFKSGLLQKRASVPCASTVRPTTSTRSPATRASIPTSTVIPTAV